MVLYFNRLTILLFILSLQSDSYHDELHYHDLMFGIVRQMLYICAQIIIPLWQKSRQQVQTKGCWR